MLDALTAMIAEIKMKEVRCTNGLRCLNCPKYRAPDEEGMNAVCLEYCEQMAAELIRRGVTILAPKHNIYKGCCDTCQYDNDRECAGHKGCGTCPLYTDGECACLKIEASEKCPYYKETKNEDA